MKNKKISGIAFMKKNIPGWILIIPSIILFVLIIWRPIVIGISYSFFDLKGFTPVKFVGLDNYRDVLSDTNFIQTLWNTVRYVFWSLVIGFPLPFILAIMLNEMVHSQSYFKNVYYLPVIIPSIATSLIWQMIYMEGDGGLLNSILYNFGVEPMRWLSNKELVIPLIITSMTWNGFGGTVLMYLGTLQGINNELYEAARLDGAGVWGRMRYIMFPHMKGVLALMFVQQIIGIFNITERPLTMTGGGPNGASLSLGLTNYFYAFKYAQFDRSLALGVITFIILIGLTVLYLNMDKADE